MKIAADSALQAFRINQQRDLVADEARLHEARAALETVRKQHGAALAVIEDETRRRQVKTANTEDRALALVKALPAALAGLRATELHLGDDPLRSLANALTRAVRKDDVNGRPASAEGENP